MGNPRPLLVFLLAIALTAALAANGCGSGTPSESSGTPGSSSGSEGGTGEGGTAPSGSVEPSPHTPATGCRSGFSACGDVCADLTNDRRHCGGCGAACFGLCIDRACADAGVAGSCPSLTCNGACVSARSVDHCASCFNRCGDTQICTPTGCIGGMGTGQSCQSPLVLPAEGEREFRFPSVLTSMHRFPCGPLADVPTRWFRYTPQKSDSKSGFQLESPAGDDWVIEIFSGGCDGLVSLGCSTGGPNDMPHPEIVFNGVAGQTYMLAAGRISGASTTNPRLDLSD